MQLLRDATMSRGTFIRGAAGGLALAALGGPLAPLQAAAAEMGDNEEDRLVTPPTDPNGFAEMGSESNGAFL